MQMKTTMKIMNKVIKIKKWAIKGMMSTKFALSCTVTYYVQFKKRLSLHFLYSDILCSIQDKAIYQEAGFYWIASLL